MLIIGGKIDVFLAKTSDVYAAMLSRLMNLCRPNNMKKIQDRNINQPSIPIEMIATASKLLVTSVDFTEK